MLTLLRASPMSLDLHSFIGSLRETSKCRLALRIVIGSHCPGTFVTKKERLSIGGGSAWRVEGSISFRGLLCSPGVRLRIESFSVWRICTTTVPSGHLVSCLNRPTRRTRYSHSWNRRSCQTRTVNQPVMSSN